jgi:hypothetical protein
LDTNGATVDVLVVALAAITAGLALGALRYAKQTTDAARDTVKLTRAAAAEQQRWTHIQRLERVADLVSEVGAATMAVMNAANESAQCSGNAAMALVSQRHAQIRLRAACAGSGVVLRNCLAAAGVDGGQADERTVEAALDEVRSHIAQFGRWDPGVFPPWIVPSELP